MGLFDIFGGGEPDLEKDQEAAFLRELERIRQLQRGAREASGLLSTEGEGVSTAASFKFGDELDLEDLSPEEREARATGRIELNTGLIL